MGRRANRSPKKPRKLKAVHHNTPSMRGRGFNRQLQWVINNVRRYFEAEKDANRNLLPFHQALKRTCQALGVSERSVRRVTRRVESGQPFETPGKEHPNRKRPKRDVDDFTKDAIRNLIYDMHHKGAVLTLTTLLFKIRERDIGFTGSTRTLMKVLNDLGFTHQKRDSKRFLMELPRIVVQRIGYLRNFLYHVLVKGLPIIYMDESWIYRWGTGKRRDWQDSDPRSVPRGARIASLGARYILVHAGSKEGFVEGAGLIYQCNTKPKPGDDYHGDMNHTMFRKWFLNQLLPNLHQPSGIVADNAPYHSTQVKWKDIFDAMTVEELKGWLSKEDVPYTASMSLKQLRELCVVKAKEFGPSYELENMVKNTPHVILRLPPYHPMLNAIEFIWSLTKGYMEAHARNGKSIEENFKDAVASISPEVWSKVHDKVVKIALELYRKDLGKDFDVKDYEESIRAENCNTCVIALGEDDSSSEGSSDDEWVTESDSEGECRSQDVSADSTAPFGLTPLPKQPSGSRPEQSTSCQEERDILQGRSEKERSGVLALLALSNECSTPADLHVSPEVIVVHDDGEIISDVPLSVRESLTMKDLDHRRDDEVIVTMFHETIDVASLRTLKPRQWLNGRVVNFYLALTIQEFSRSCGRKVFALDSLFFRDYQSRGFSFVQHKTMEVDVFDLDILFIPIHLSNHWCLCAVNVQKRTLSYYDSMGGSNEDALQVVLKWLQEEHVAKKHKRLPGAWKKEHAKPVAQQDNNDDCGVFVLCYCRLLCEGRSCNFKMDPSAVRATLFKEILTCRLQKLPLDTVSVAMSAVKLPKKTASSAAKRGPESGEDASFSSEDLDAILVCGDEYYRECKWFANSNNVYLAMDELQPEMQTPSGVFQMQWTASAQGQFSEVHTELPGVVRDQMTSSVRGHAAFLFMGHSKTVCFVPLTERRAWFFNSHSVNEQNKYSQRGKARLFCCYSVEALTSLLLSDHPRDNQWWQLYKLTFQKKPPSEEEVDGV